MQGAVQKRQGEMLLSVIVRIISDYGKGVFVLFTGRLGIVSLAFRSIGRYSWFHRDSALNVFVIAAKQATF